MKTNKDLIFRSIAGEYVLVPTGKMAQNMNGMIHLTETAAFIWQNVDEKANLQEMADAMVEEFDVDMETAQKDVYCFLVEFNARGFVSDVPEFEGLEYHFPEEGISGE